MAAVGDTIYALSSGSLPSGVAVVRVSGKDAFSYCRAVAGDVPAPRKARLMRLVDAAGLPIDTALVLAFAGPASFTGEDCIEFQLHGGRAVVRALLDRLAGLGLRHAEAGEFTRRAFENGKIDLVEAEGLSDMIAAETEMQRRLALEQAGGGLSELYEGWARELTHARAMIEAELDFSDEDDIPGSVSATIWGTVEEVGRQIESHIAGSRAGEIIRDGYRVVIAGPPNAGKSSLLNALARRDVAIVTDVAGTTRDILEVYLDLDGYAVRLCDTAGLRDSDDVVEAEGMRRARALLEEADLILSLSDIGAGQPVERFEGECLRIGTKADTGNETGGDFDLVISSRTGAGMDHLVEMIKARLEARLAGASLSLPVRDRQVGYLKETLRHIQAALDAREHSPEIPAEALRQAAVALGRITGRVDVEDLLDVIFSSFCVGK